MTAPVASLQDSAAVLQEMLNRANDDLRQAQGLAEEVTPRRRIAALTAAIAALASPAVDGGLRMFADAVERLAFKMPAPNEWTPQFVSLAIEARRLATPEQPGSAVQSEDGVDTINAATLSDAADDPALGLPEARAMLRDASGLIRRLATPEQPGNAVQGEGSVSESAAAIREAFASGQQPKPGDMSKVFGDPRQSVSICTTPPPAPAAEQPDFPECSGDPASCPENEGYGCCKRNDGSQWQSEARGVAEEPLSICTCGWGPCPTHTAAPHGDGKDTIGDETGPYPFGAGLQQSPAARYWQQRSEFWMGKAISLGWREVRDAANGEVPATQPEARGVEAPAEDCTATEWLDFANGTSVEDLASALATPNPVRAEQPEWKGAWLRADVMEPEGTFRTLDGKPVDTPATRIAARIARDIYRHANQAGACGLEFAQMIHDEVLAAAPAAPGAVGVDEVVQEVMERLDKVADYAGTIDGDTVVFALPSIAPVLTHALTAALAGKDASHDR